MPTVYEETIQQEDDNPYRQTLREESKQAETGLRVSVGASADKTPDRQAEILELSRRTELPSSVVERNFDAIKKRSEVADTDYSRMMKETPKLSGWVSKPENMALAKDDLVPLGTLEKVLGFGVDLAADLASALPSFNAAAANLALGVHENVKGALESVFGPAQRDPITPFLRDYAKGQQSVAEALRPETGNRFVGSFHSGVQSVGTSLLTLPAGLMGGARKAVAALGLVTAGQSYGQGREQGLSPVEAGVFGLSQGAIEAGTELGPWEALFKGLKLNQGLGRVLWQNMKGEVVGEQIATALQDLNEYAVLPENAAKTFGDYALERPGAAIDTLIATAVGVVGQVGPTHVLHKLVHGKPAEQRFFEELGKSVEASKTRERLPEKLRELVAEMTADGPVETVYAPLETWNKYWQEKELNPREIARELTGSNDAYDQAAATGADLEIQTADYAVKLAATEHNAFFAKELRFDPTQMNAREAEELEASLAETPESLTETPEADPSQRIAEDIRGQLLNTGFDEKTVNSYAQLYAAAFKTLGERSGLDPFTLYQPYKLQITRPLPEILRTLPDIDMKLDSLLDRLRAGQVPSQQEMFGNSLVEFIRQSGGVQDEGGELAALEVDYGRKPYQKNLIQEEGLALDRARELAAEAGYLPSDASTADFLDLIEREIRGQAVYSPAFTNESLVSEAQVYAQLSGFLNQLGVDLAATPNEEVRKLLQQSGKPEGEQFNQNDSPLGQDTLGALTIGPNRRMTIELLEKADLSTVLHESGHFFLEVLGDVAEELKTRPGEPTAEQAGVVADYDAVLKHLGVESREAIGRDQHELFARSFEAYLREGKAPSAELRSVFMRFRDWLVALYRSLSELRVTMSPEITGIFDRLIASDAEIERAREEANIEALLANDQIAQDLGLSQEEMAAYGETVRKAANTERENLQRRYLAEYQRESEEWYQQQREKVRTEVAQEVHSQKGYIALAFLQKGTLPDGSSLPEGITAVKLDARSLEDTYGKYRDSSIVQALRKLRVYARDGGVPADAAAEVLGYSSGDEMIQVLVRLPDMNAFIEAETNDRMRQTYGDIRIDGSAAEKARDAVMASHSDVLQAEMKALARKVKETAPFVKLGQQQERQAQRAGFYVPKISDLQRIARSRVSELKARDLNPGVYWASARRAGISAQEKALAGKYDEAFQWKLKQALSLEMYRAVQEARAEVDKIADHMRSFDSPKVRARIGKAGESYLEQIDKLRERYSYAPVTLKEADKRSRLKDWVEAQQAQGLPVDIPEYLQDESLRVDWRNAPVAELRGLDDSVSHIAHLARLKNKLLKAKDKREFKETVEGLAASIDGNAKGPRKKILEPRLPNEELGRWVSAAFASHRKLSEILREMDGFKDGGALWESIIRPINEAAETETTRNAEATKALTGLFDEAFKGRQSTLYKKMLVPGAGFSLSKQGAILFALNWGNEGNRQRLLGGGIGRSGPLSTQQAQAVLDTLDERDWKFVQDIWKHINSYWGEISDKQQRVEGVRPEKVDAAPFQTKFGEMPGGYFPIVYEGRVDPKAQGDIESEFAETIRKAAYVKASTKRGHTKERVEKVSRPVRLDFDVITEHVQNVLHDLTHHEMLIDVGRLLGDRSVSQAMVDHYGDIVYDTIKGHVRDVAWGNAPTPRWYKPFNYFRQGSVVAGLGWNATTAILQPMGAFDAIRPVGAKYMYRGVTRFARNAMAMEGTSRWIQERSALMANRSRTQFRELNEIKNRVGLNRGKVYGWMADSLSKLGVDPAHMPVVADSFFYFIQKGQQVADTLTFLGAYEKFMDDPGNSEDRAVALAEQMVIHTQGSGHIKDLAAVEKGNPVLKLFTTFYSYQNKQLQLEYEAVKKADPKAPKTWGRLAVDMLFFVMIPAAVYMALHQRGDDDDSIVKTYGIQLLSDLLGPFVFIREFGGALQGFDYSGPAGLSWIANVANAGKQISQGEADEALFKTVNKAGGTLFHYPATQVQRTALGMEALWEGKTVNPAALLFGPPKD